MDALSETAGGERLSAEADPIHCTRPSATVVSDHPAVVEFSRRHADHTQSAREAAIALYFAVRDGFRYDPYGVQVSVAALRADHTVELGRGWCVSKAILLAAACRAKGIPARLGFADVRNHLSTQRMRERMQTDVFYWHGYTAIYLDGAWMKATPAFNIGLCRKFNLVPLDFDGTGDSIYHPFDASGNEHMEYIRYRGEFLDVPSAAMTATFRQHYPYMFEDAAALAGANFDADVDSETSGT